MYVQILQSSSSGHNSSSSPSALNLQSIERKIIYGLLISYATGRKHTDSLSVKWREHSKPFLSALAALQLPLVRRCQ